MTSVDEIAAFASQRPEEVALEKFSKKGFNKLSLEELALTQVSASWREEFQRATGESWDVYQPKAAERLRRANFDMKWLTKRSDNAFVPLFTAVVRGDTARVTEYIRINDLQTCIDAVDETKKTCLHLAAREGHSELVDLLLNKGWSVDARDRLLNTPLHLACYRGHPTVVTALLKKRADTQAGDSSGRKAVHYACSAMDSEALKILIRQDRDCIHSTDNSGRGPMHYVVYNNSARQIDFIRVLLENGCSVDQTDSLGRTPLHYACEAARSRCIPMLLKNGAKLSAQDNSGKTPSDLIKNEQIHQVISLYVKPEPEKDAGLLAAKGATAPLFAHHSPTKAKQSPSEPVLQIPVSKQERREVLLSLLKRVQEAGVNAQQHLKKPHIFSGAWMEGIAAPPALLQALASWTPAEAVLRVFNVLYPYPKQLPVPQGDEYAISEFYGEAWNGGPAVVMESAEEQVEERPVGKPAVVVDDRRTRELETRITAQDKELFRLRRELQTLERKAKDSDRVNDLQEQLLSAEDDRDLALAAKDRLQKEVAALRAEIDEMKAKMEALNKKLSSVPQPEEVDDLKKALLEKDSKDRALRFKSGLLFLKSLDIKSEGEAPKTELHLQDGQVIERLTAALAIMKPSLKQRLTDVDMNADGNVTKSEMTKALDKLGMTPQDILSLLRIAGFRPGVPSVPILPFVQAVESWAGHKATLVARLFTKLQAKFRGKPLEDLFQMLDVNHDGTISFAEFGDACNMLKLNMSREERHSVFAVLDEDHTGSISLDELRAQIEAADEVQDDKIEEERQEEEDDLNDKDEEAEGENEGENEDEKEGVDSLDQEFNPDSEGESPMKQSAEAEIPVVKTKQPVFPSPVVTAKQPASQPAKQPANQPVKAPVKQPVNPEEKVEVPTKPLYGRLSLQIVKARDLPPGKYAVQCTLPGADGPQRTEFAAGPAPEWKYRGRFKLEGLKPNALPDSIKVELFGASGVDAVTQIPWQKCLAQPGNWAINSEFTFKDKSGKPRGLILVQLKWLPRDSLRLEGSGDLYIQPLQATGFRDCIVFFSLSGKSARTASGPPWTETASLRDVKLSALKAVPALEVSVLEASSQKEVVKSSFNWESVLAAPNQMSQEIRMSLSSKHSLVLKMKWRPFTPEEEAAIKCATKIQAWWRGKKAREQVKLQKPSPRKVLRRTGQVVENKFYLLSVTKDQNGLQADLHPVGDPAIPIYTVVDTMKLEEGQEERVTVGKGDKLQIGQPAAGEEQLRGDLGVKVTAALGLEAVMLKFVIDKAFAHSLAGPPWPRPMMLKDVKTGRSQTAVTVTVIELANRTELFQKTSDFRGSLGTPGSWSPEAVIDFSATAKLKLQYQWMPLPEVTAASVAAATKVQAAWRGKVARDEVESLKQKRREVIARSGLKADNGRYYLVTFYKEQGGVGIGLHRADDPGQPMFEELDYRQTKETSLTALQSRLRVAADGKLIL